MKISVIVSLLSCALALFSAGCATMPMSGPERVSIETGTDQGDLNYAVVNLTGANLRIVNEYDIAGFNAYFQDRRPPPIIKFGVGDVVSVTIFEAAAGGLFIPIEAGVRPGNFVQIPNQTVDAAGNITVPYAGQIRAVGRTPNDVQQEIIRAISNRAIEPQVVVTLADQRTSLISVLGEVNQPSRLQANAAGERVLDVITRAGGIRGQGYESWVTLERHGKKATVPFGSLVYNSANNIWVHPGDVIYVYREPQVFLAFGASGQQGQFPFDMWKISLSQALAKAGGLLDNQAEPAGVYVYRREPRELAARLGVDVRKFPGSSVPIVYGVDMRQGAGFFLTTKFPMRDRDVVFVANAETVNSAKFLQFVRLIVATANDGLVVANNTQVLRINARQ